MRDSGPVAAQSQSRRRGLRLSVRAMMIVVLIVGGGLGWTVYRARVQRDAVAAIEKAGGSVVYEWDWKDSRSPARGRRRVPRILIEYFGRDYFGSIKCVHLRNLNGAVTTDSLLEHVAQFDRLEYLGVACGPLSDEGPMNLRRLTHLKDLVVYTSMTGASLKCVRGMTELKELRLCNSSVTDADLVHVKDLTGLETLQLGSPYVTDEGLKLLEGLSNLKLIDLDSSQVTSAGLSRLGHMTRLRGLCIANTQVSDLVPIRHLTGLRSLRLHSTPITNRGLAPVVNFPSLQSLDISRTAIDDEGLECLRSLTKLRRLSLDGTRISDAGLSRLANLAAIRDLSLIDTGINGEGLSGFRCATTFILNLSGTKITDQGLSNLKGLKVGWVDVTRSAVTPPGIAGARKSLPGLWISR